MNRSCVQAREIPSHLSQEPTRAPRESWITRNPQLTTVKMGILIKITFPHLRCWFYRPTRHLIGFIRVLSDRRRNASEKVRRNIQKCPNTENRFVSCFFYIFRRREEEQIQNKCITHITNSLDMQITANQTLNR